MPRVWLKPSTDLKAQAIHGNIPPACNKHPIVIRYETIEAPNTSTSQLDTIIIYLASQQHFHGLCTKLSIQPDTPRAMLQIFERAQPQSIPKIHMEKQPSATTYFQTELQSIASSPPAKKQGDLFGFGNKKDQEYHALCIDIEDGNNGSSRCQTKP